MGESNETIAVTVLVFINAQAVFSVMGYSGTDRGAFWLPASYIYGAFRLGCMCVCAYGRGEGKGRGGGMIRNSQGLVYVKGDSCWTRTKTQDMPQPPHLFYTRSTHTLPLTSFTPDLHTPSSSPVSHPIYTHPPSHLFHTRSTNSLPLTCFTPDLHAPSLSPVSHPIYTHPPPHLFHTRSAHTLPLICSTPDLHMPSPFTRFTPDLHRPSCLTCFIPKSTHTPTSITCSHPIYTYTSLSPVSHPI